MSSKAIYFLLGSVLVLVCIGIIMLFSTSAFAQDSRGDMLFFVKRQAIWMVLGAVVCVVAACVDYHIWQKLWLPLFVVTVILLILCFIPPFGMKINGSWRWLNLKFMAFQPSEVAKIAAIFFLAWWFTKFEKKSARFFMGFVFPAGIVSILLGLIAMEVDLGTTALIGAVMFSMMFVAGTSLWILVPLVCLGFAGLIGVAMMIPQRMDRLLAFLDPEKHRLHAGLQQWEAQVAFGSGGVNGLGLGEGIQKMLYLPYAHTDFIFPMIGEELGLRFTLLVVLCFLMLCLAGCLVAVQAKDRFGLLIGFGLVMAITIQAVVNIGVTTSLFPNKGMPLPFISYGGSNLLICFFMVGTLVNIYRQRRISVPMENQSTADYQPAMRW